MYMYYILTFTEVKDAEKECKGESPAPQQSNSQQSEPNPLPVHGATVVTTGRVTTEVNICM